MKLFIGNLCLENKLMEEENKKTTDIDESAALAILLKRVANHDKSAFSELYDTHSGLLMSVIKAVLNDSAESEDILQDSFITIWNKAAMYQSHLGKPTSWMITIAKNKAYDRYRKLVRKSEGMKAIKDNMVNPMAVLPPKADNEKLILGIKELNTEQKESIELVFYQGYTQQETAEKLDIPLGTVKARIRRGLLKLKQIISNN